MGDGRWCLPERPLSSSKLVRRYIGEEVNRAQLLSCWINGWMIVLYEQNGKDRAKYGAKTLKTLSARLKVELGCGYSVTSLQNMRRFYLTYQNNRRCLLN